MEESIREIRINPIVPSESVLIATARSQRPRKQESQYKHDSRAYVPECQFCPGHEEQTPPQIMSVPEDQPWRIRIVRNLYPVLADDDVHPVISFGVQQAIDGYGRHEVVIDHSTHGIQLYEMNVDHLALLFTIYRDRMNALYERDQRIRSVLVFKNFGPAAGGSIPHTHSQIIAMPVVPQNINDEVTASKSFYDKHGHCVFCTLIDEALTFEATFYDRMSGAVRRKINVGQYVVDRSKKFIAIKPFASRFEWEIHILPLAHCHDFCDATTEDLQDFAFILHQTMRRLHAVLGSLQYNFFLHSSPHDDSGVSKNKAFHWHLEICPRTSIPTGFELGSGLFVNSLAPEVAAEKLRSALLSET